MVSTRQPAWNEARPATLNPDLFFNQDDDQLSETNRPDGEVEDELDEQENGPRTPAALKRQSINDQIDSGRRSRGKKRRHVSCSIASTTGCQEDDDESINVVAGTEKIKKNSDTTYRKLMADARIESFIFMSTTGVDGLVKKHFAKMEPEENDFQSLRKHVMDTISAYKGQVTSRLKKHVLRAMEVDETLVEMVSFTELQAYFLARFNPANFYEVWKYISGYLDIFDDAAPLTSKWYAENLYVNLCISVKRWVDAQAGREDETSTVKNPNDAWAEVLLLYDIMPTQDEFNDIDRHCFIELEGKVKGQRDNRPVETSRKEAAKKKFRTTRPLPPPLFNAPGQSTYRRGAFGSAVDGRRSSGDGGNRSDLIG